MRSHYCGQVTETLDGHTVEVCGWVDGRRDLGGLIFMDLRDREGLVQVVVEPDNADVFRVAEGVRNEYVLRVSGKVRSRPEGQRNPDMATGQIEIVADDIEVLNTSDPLPLMLSGEASEEVRLRYRYLDLRRPVMQRALKQRAQLITSLRRFLDERGFIETETPMLTRATPEGARDYLVPSRVHAGSFYALPQSPQIFKQLLMIAGLDRYYQIARCFRDEDLRSDRQPEFTQLDVEMSFVEEEDVMQLMEAMLRHVFRAVLDVELPDPFPRMTWREAMRRYGSDKPDLRIPLELTDIADLVRDVEFKVFAEPAADPHGRVAALRVPGGAELSRKQIDDYADYAGKFGARGLAWMKVEADGVKSPIAKFLDDAAVSAICERCQASKGDILFFGAGLLTTVSEFMGALRVKVGHDRGLVEEGWQPLWVTEWPLFEWDDKAGRFNAMNHPFTSPAGDVASIESNPCGALARAYDVVLNGSEIGGGSIRIHDPGTQLAVLKLLGMDETEARSRFGFLIEALRYGTPPHGGIAFGVDRIAALMAGRDSIRDVIAFPKTTAAACPMTDAPSPIDADQLDELHISVAPPSED